MKQQLFTTDDAVSAACAVSTKRRGRLLAMAAGILSVLILLVTAMQFVILAGADRYSEYSDDCRKFMMDYMKKSSSYDTLVNKTYSPYRNYVESLGRDTLFQADLVAWKIATFDLKNGATQVTNSKEYKYYLGILMDLLSECTQDKDFLGKVKDVSDASHVSTVKAVMNFDEKYNNLYMKLNPSEADEIKNVLSEISSIQSFLGTVSNFKDLIEQAKNLDDLLYKLSQAQVIYDLMTGYGDTMQDMYNRCDDDNPALKAALLTVRDLCNQSMSKVNMVTLFAGGTVAEEGLKVALGAVQKEIVNAMGLTGAAITLAQSAGKMYANALFGTEDMLTAYYQMDALYDIENLVRLSLAWADDADSFFSAFSLYENIIYKGVTYSENYMKSIYEDSVVGVLFAWASGKDKEYEVFKSNMTSFKVDTFASFSSLQKSAYNAFINSKYTSDISNYFTVTDLYTLPSDEEIKQNDEEIERLSIQACGLPDEDYTLNDDLTILNNLYHSNGTIDLNGHTLTINGDLILEDGGINVNGGELIIKGNYNAYKATTNKDGTITYSAGGYLSMNNINDKVTVEGDFDTYSDYKTEYWDCLIFGEIEIKGNLIDHYNGGSTTYGLYSNGTKFIFSGTGKQTIKATDGYIYFENVEFVNKDTTGSIEFDNTKISCHIEKNETVTGNLCIEDMDLKGHKLTVNGDLKLWGGLWLNGGELYITGNYDAYIPVKNADGTTSYTGGQLVTSNVNDKVTVDGDFDTYSDYKADHWDCLIFGEIEIKGNLIDHYNDGNTDYGLYSHGTKFIFSGTGKQTITAKDGYIYFENVEFVNKDTTGSIEFDNTKISCHIEKDETVTGNLCIEDMDLKGHKLTVNGDLKLWGGLWLNGGELYITGNYDAYIPVKNADGTTSYTGGQLVTSNVNDKVTVDGDFDTYSDYKTEYWDCLIFGEIEIKGNLIDHYNDGNTTYGLYSYGTQFIFSGTGTQTITALDGKLVLNTAEFVNKNVQIACSTEIDVDVPVRVHDYSDEWTVDVEAACNDGSKSHHCTRCDAKKDITVIPGNGHTVVIDAAVAPSCTEPGLTEGSHCSVCNTVIKAQETVPATGHDFENGICKNCNKTEAETIQSKHPYDNSCDETWTIHRDGATRINVTFTDETYTESGYDYIYIYDGDDKLIGKYSGSELSGKTISVNSDTVKIRLTSDSSNTEYGFALDKIEYSTEALCDHSNTEIRNAKSAGCTTEGYTGDTYCKDCGEKISSGEVIPATGHTEVTDKAVEATCTKTGLTEGKHCSVCDAVIKAQEVVPAKGHTEVVDKAVAATCTKTGLTEGKHCSVCDAVIKAQETVPATGKHSFGDWKITKAATCTAEGTQTRTCSGCGKVETQTIAKTAHKYVNTVVKPTYTAQGYTLHKCSVCGTSYKDTYTAKLTLAKVTGVKLAGRAADALRVNWNKDVNASGYIVEMYQGNKWVRAAKIASNATTTYRASGLKASTVYKFRVRAYKMSGKTAVYGAYSATVAARTNPSVIKGAKLGGRAADALRINWTKNTSADGYIVEMYQGGKWVRVAKITNNSTTTFRKAGLSASSVYKFRVRAYKMSGKTALYGNYSATVTARTNPSVVKGVKIAGKAKDALRVNWTKNTSAQGYIVEMYKGGKWVRVAKITNGNTTTYRKAGLAKNTTYKFRVKAYYMSGKTALYGNYGSVSGKTAAK